MDAVNMACCMLIVINSNIVLVTSNSGHMAKVYANKSVFLEKRF